MNLPEPIPKDNNDLPEPVKDNVDLVEASKHTRPQESAKSKELRKMVGNDSDEIVNANGDPPEYRQDTRQQSNTEGYQPMASPMSA